MKKKPKPPAQATQTGPRPGQAHGGGSGAPVAAHHPAAKKPAPRPAAINPGGPMRPAPAARKKPAKKPAKRKLALGESVACCAAEAVAASLRLTGHSVSDADVLALYWRTADGPDAGATILATLEAASEQGLAKARVTGFEPASRSEITAPLFGRDDRNDRRLPFHMYRGASHANCTTPWLSDYIPLILGLELPEGPHAVLADGTCWWSWGEPYDPADFPGAVIEECWEVTW